MIFNASDKVKLVACLKRLQRSSVHTVVNDEEFLYYHKNRNGFNVSGVNWLKANLSNLTSGQHRYTDNHGRVWIEERIGIKYHVPAENWPSDAFRDVKNRYARKFLLMDNLPGWHGASSEMIIHQSGSRIVRGPYMETYNYGVSGFMSTFNPGWVGNVGPHKLFDVDPHKAKGYGYYMNRAANAVVIHDLKDLARNHEISKRDAYSQVGPRQRHLVDHLFQ